MFSKLLTKNILTVTQAQTRFIKNLENSEMLVMQLLGLIHALKHRYPK